MPVVKSFQDTTSLHKAEAVWTLMTEYELGRWLGSFAHIRIELSVYSVIMLSVHLNQHLNSS